MFIILYCKILRCTLPAVHPGLSEGLSNTKQNILTTTSQIAMKFNTHFDDPMTYLALPLGQKVPLTR